MSSHIFISRRRDDLPGFCPGTDKDRQMEGRGEKKDWGGGKEGWRERRKPGQQVNQPTYREGGEEQNKNFRKEERTDEGEKEKEMTEDHWSRREGI